MATQAEPTTELNTTEGIDLLHYWNLFWRNKFIIAFFGLLFAVPTVFIELEKPNTYEATAALSIEQDQGPNIMDIEGLYGVNTQSRTYASTQFEILRAKYLAERVIKNLDLLNNPYFFPVPISQQNSSSDIAGQDNRLIQQAKLNRAIAMFGNQLRIIPIRNTSIVNIRFSATNPQLAADIANGVAHAYIELDHERRVSSAQQASLWLAERAANLNEDLQRSEAKLQAFLEREQLVDSGNAGDVTSLTTQQINLLNSQLSEAQARRIEVETIYEKIQTQDNPSAIQLLSFPAIANHISIIPIRQNYETITQQITELSRRYGRNHPQMIDLQIELQDAEKRLIAQVQQVFTNEYQIALNNEDRIKAQLGQSRSELRTINSKGFELQELRREVETNRQLYEMFFTRIRETQETNDLMSTNAVLVDPAVPALYPSGPGRRKNVIFALALGLALGGGLVFAKDFLNSSIKSYKDIESRLNTQVLGIIPFVDKVGGQKPKKKENQKYGDGLHQKLSPRTAEAFRTIRTALELASIDHQLGIISVTSSRPGEGKTTVAYNLASVFARLGRRVLLIDTDLRKPSLAKLIDAPDDRPGLTDYLCGRDLQSCMIQNEQGEFMLMTSGKPVANELELISSRKFEHFLNSLRDNFDHIILDTPPTLAVSDSLILSNLSDATIFIVKASSTPTRVLKNQLARLRKAEANIVGVVLNQLKDIEKNADYGGYYDSYGYTSMPSK